MKLKVLTAKQRPKPEPEDNPYAHQAELEERYKPDDDEIALPLAPELNGKVAFFHSSWKVYENGCWQTRDNAEMRRYIRRELRSWRRRGVTVTQNRIRALAAMLEDDLFVADREVMEVQDQQRNYINLKNGLFNLETMALEPHKPELFFTTQLNFDYDPDADCPNFRKFLNSSLVHEDGTTDFSLVKLMQQALAYSMTARTDMKASFWLVGQKDSGKSTFISVIKNLMGSLHTTIDLTQLGVNRFLLAGIAGKRVVTFTEASGSSVLPDALYKALTGGSDEIYADVKNRDAIAFRPEAKIWWAMNEMPRVNDRSGATTRRIVMIPFNRSIPEHERIQNLEFILKSEHSGIFNALMAWYQRLVHNKQFEYCEQSEALRREYIQENDTEATFIAECAELHESYKIRGGELYDTYKTWCDRFGFRAKSANQLAKEWRRLGFEQKTSDGSWWHGLRLKKHDQF